jgi:hypothetical protein
LRIAEADGRDESSAEYLLLHISIRRAAAVSICF